ncbi:pseudouridine synthase [Mycoplasmopsis primatum]|uniref:pseudouridine synthase n=1 Tax=Mycoplasmopsis primatum TaxID=55604 RepID=UPI000496F472|nr:pseudouridine synthase [Mycoplasmopsis primatum]
MKIRIEKYICDLTNLSRSEVKSKIAKKLIKVNNQIINKPIKVDSNLDVVFLDGVELKYEQFQYYMFNKPMGFICANNDLYSPTVFDIVGLPKKKYFTFGRLDKDTEGLLIISNDGQMCHKVLSPQNHIQKKYYVKVDKNFDDDILTNCLPITIDKDFVVNKYIFEKIDNKSCLLTIYEGKFHQVKKMFGALGYSVIYLKRVQFGNLLLDNNLKPGQIKKLNNSEIKQMQGLE